MLDEETGDPILAEDFIDFAAELKMMGDIDQWVISNALKSLAEHKQRFPKTRFFLKLSQQTICDHEFVDWLINLLKENDIPGESLTFEVSETDAVANIDETLSLIHI